MTADKISCQKMLPLEKFGVILPASKYGYDKGGMGHDI